MISVNCSQCRATLEMDDAFAGGVCRCHYCGTIQTVPSNAKRIGQAPAVRVAPAGQNGSGEAPAAPPPPPGHADGDGLNALADAIAGNGAGRAGAHAPPAQPVDYARPPRQRSLLIPIAIGLAVLVLLMCGLLGYLLVGRTVVVTGGTGTGGPGAGGTGTGGTVGPQGGADIAPVPPGGGGTPVATPAAPHYLGIDLSNATTVVYILDRGHATAELFDTLKEATYRSLATLKPGQNFQIMFWDKPDDRAAYPADGPVAVSQQEIEAAREKFAELVAGGRATAEGAVARAAASKPDVIVLVTAKSFDLDEGLVRVVQQATAGTGTKVHTVALGGDDGNNVLKNIASKTKGEFKVVTAPELRAYSN
jgi:hypothetical protein